MDQEIFQPFDKTVKQNIQNWLEGSYDEATKNEIRKKLKSDPSCLVNAFYKPLTFGTAGARGIMGIGTNRFNKYTIRSMTQGVANYIKKQNFENPSVVISYDNRNNSHFFAEQTARVLAANGIHAYLFENLRPTPLLSFACRFKRCSAGIMITASHNPPEYNGYKVYWSDGAQVLPPHDVGIINEVENIEDPSQIEIAPITDQHIEKIESELDHVYIEAIRPLQSYKEVNHIDGKNLSIVYTNLHGTGITMIPKALSDWGFSNLHLVTEQMETNGDFPFAKKPNPEEKECLEPGIELMLKEKADVMIATDPDADRMGVVI
ncbi:MAG TPA: phospho-sugar mutase, partial [Chlamydiales bacterium]|nr:phospho-sugar mutase [Chlamydiales bacterium]